MDLYDRLKDKSIVKRVNEIFYKKVYEHPWISKYFTAVTEEFITQQQTDFIIGSIGGPKNFSGRMPSNAHPHMMITDELYDLRSDLLKEALKEANAPQELADAWLKIDEAFRRVIVKTSPSQCEKRWTTDEILDFQNPNPKKKAA